jgi:aminoglycoside 6'-N-acetyltransferase I
MNLAIRPASLSDRDGWVGLRTELWPHCTVERHALEMCLLLKAPGVVALAFVDEKLAGFAEVSVRSDHVEGTAICPVPYLEGWYVRPSNRGRGVGRALVEFVTKWSAAEGFAEMASDAEMENTRGIQLHAQLGFREVGRTVHFVRPLKNE